MAYAWLPRLVMPGKRATKVFASPAPVNAPWPDRAGFERMALIPPRRDAAILNIASGPGEDPQGRKPPRDPLRKTSWREAVLAASLVGLALVAAFAPATFALPFSSHGAFVPLVGLFTRLTKADAFTSSRRSRIFEEIRSRPGLSYSDLVDTV